MAAPVPKKPVREKCEWCFDRGYSKVLWDRYCWWIAIGQGLARDEVDSLPCQHCGKG